MSIGFFDSLYTEIVTMIFMIISSLPFILIFHCLRKNILDLFKNSQVQFFLVFILLIVLIVTSWLTKYYEVDYFQALRIASFAVISIATGSGFSTYDFSTWALSQLLLFYL